MKKRILALLLTVALLVSLAACGADNTNDTVADVEENVDVETVKIGVNPVPHGEVLEALQPEFEAAGIVVDIVEFTDYIQPNLALAEGDLDLNYFQHVPYMDNFNEEHDLDIVSLGNVHIEPIAVFSAEYDSLDELPDGATVLIPNDPTNGTRALLILQREGLIELADPTDIKATEADIIKNPKNLQFNALEAVTVANTYEDGDIAVINANYAIDVGLDVINDSLVIEDADSPYANVLSSRPEDADNPTYQKILEILQSDATKKFIEETYNGAVIPAFD